MGKISKPKAGSRGYYPRVRAKSIVAKFNGFNDYSEFKVLNFYGYKAGMMHVMGTNQHKGSPLNAQRVAIPATVIEFPDVKVYGIRFYTKELNALKVAKEFNFYSKANKELSRRLVFSNNSKVNLKEIEDFAKDPLIVDARLIVHTNPVNTTIGKKKPEVVEIFMSGSINEKVDFFKSKVGENLSVDEVFKEGSFLDVKAVSKGYGFEGVIKRFGIKRRSHKAEKGARRVGSIGPWHPATVLSTVPRPGQRGFHNRTAYNLKLLKFLNPQDLSNSSGWLNYGEIKNKSMVVAGSVPGPKKRLITFRDAVRPHKDIKYDISGISSMVF